MPIITKYYCDYCNTDISDDAAKWSKVLIHCSYHIDNTFNKDLFLCTDCWFKFRKVIMNENEADK